MSNKSLICITVIASALLLPALARADERGGNGADIREARQQAQAQASLAMPPATAMGEPAANPPYSMRRPTDEK
ncbi:hypothetical protein [Aquitalea sp. LB_tupeE]|uniref:hypothetical protein n=1 Tax=Aquitalea sp. LB_tupeE TaxID=2748078 RepID=UPI0015B832EE|nr:hypothetical protein [Aquitalea sp. LB_tupeE]NWK77855.1 hypothetical protein [Aquitalea sp. LB_tupeE]